MVTETIKLPGIGPVKKNTALWVGLGVVGLGVVFYARSRNSSGGTAGAAAIDPVTGFPYGSPEDTAALAATTATSGSSGGGGGASASDNGPPLDTSGGIPTFASNAQWSQYVEQYMINNEQADPTTVGNAIGAYVSGASITETQRDIVHRAIAIANTPPVSGQGGFPPSFHLQAAAPPPAVAHDRTKAPYWHYTTVTFKVGKTPQSIAALVTAHSDAIVTNAARKLRAMTETTWDTHNAPYHAYSAAHHGTYPPNAAVTLHVVKQGDGPH
jgi:hypothetical protein